MITSTPHTHCRACGTTLPPAFLDLGMQPLANNLCRGDEHCDDVFPMRLARCSLCGLLQLETVIDPAAMFSHYLYTPSQSKKTLAHFEELADTASRRIAQRAFVQNFAVDIGSNDGALLGMLKARGWAVRGIDPAENLARSANEAGIPTEIAFFNDTVVDKIVGERGQADLITANNVFAHTPDWQTFARCAARLLAPDGQLAIEFPYGPTMLKDGLFDLIYFEHCSFPSIYPMHRLFKQHDLTVQDIEDLPGVHGGSVRVWISRKKKTSPAALTRIKHEWLEGPDDCQHFTARVEETKHRLADAVREAHSHGRVIGFTAPAKCVTLLTACGCSDDIDFIIDDNPLKQGRMLPRLHVPIVSLAEADLRAGDTVVVFAWNVAEDIISRLPPGVDAIIPMPQVKVIRR